MPEVISRLCPICNKLITFSKRSSLYRSIRNNSTCKRCSRIGSIFSEEHKRNISAAKKGVPGPKHSIETRKKMSRAHKGKNAVWYGKQLSKTHKENLRIARLKFVKDRYGQTYYNPKACLYFANLELENGWDGFYATKNKEYHVSGYSVDYYEPMLNMVIEYDEPHHYTLTGKLKAKDRRRESIIREKLECKFLRYNELTGELK